MKKTLKVLLAVVITPIALFLILTLLLYCPPVQKWAVEKAAQVASEKTGMRITVEQLRLSFPLDLRLQGLIDARRDIVTLGEWKSKRRSTPSKETGVLLLLISRMR